MKVASAVLCLVVSGSLLRAQSFEGGSGADFPPGFS
jgi:hypothetical protein